MRKIARLKELDRMDIFRNTAAKTCSPIAVVEKDFWVCFTLDYLFHDSPWKESLVFKGGTSLSKCFGLISRFSEDIDLTLDWRILGYEKDGPLEERSITKQKAFNEQVKARLTDFLKKTFCPIITKDISSVMGKEAKIDIDEEDPHTVIFSYPRSFSVAGILPSIRLEIGALSAFAPSRRTTITPYAAGHYPNLFDRSDTDVLAIVPERTFWDKATILHQEAHRGKEKRMPNRYSRHYYDLYCLANSPIKEKALSNLSLLREVVEMKKRFYPSGWSKYDEAVPGTFCLVPPEYRIGELKADYESMKEMIYGDKPAIEAIMEKLEELQKEINALQ